MFKKVFIFKKKILRQKIFQEFQGQFNYAKTFVTSGFGRVTITGGQNSMTVSSYITTVVCIYRNQQTI